MIPQLGFVTPNLWRMSPHKVNYTGSLFKKKPHCSATCLNTWRAEPRKKNTLSFFKSNFTPAKSKMQGVFFLSGLPSRSEAGAERYERTRQFRATTRSVRPAI